jgi:hypothetical protein
LCKRTEKLISAEAVKTAVAAAAAAAAAASPFLGHTEEICHSVAANEKSFKLQAYTNTIFAAFVTIFKFDSDIVSHTAISSSCRHTAIVQLQLVQLMGAGPGSPRCLSALFYELHQPLRIGFVLCTLLSMTVCRNRGE